MKKLVPPTRSSISRTHAPIRTAKASRPRIAVVNQAQTVSGRRIRESPFVRRSSVVTMKFSAPISEATQKMKMLMIQRFIPIPCPGPADSPSADSGA